MSREGKWDDYIFYGTDFTGCRRPYTWPAGGAHLRARRSAVELAAGVEYGLTEFLVCLAAEVTVEYTDTIGGFIDRLEQSVK